MDDDNIEKAIRDTGAKLLVLDPIQSFIGNNIDMNRANSIRPSYFNNEKSEASKDFAFHITIQDHPNRIFRKDYLPNPH